MCTDAPQIFHVQPAGDLCIFEADRMAEAQRRLDARDRRISPGRDGCCVYRDTGRRELIAIWGVLTIVFLSARLTGDPAVLMLPVGATAEQLQDFRHMMGLDRPLLEQYASFLWRALHGRLR